MKWLKIFAVSVILGASSLFFVSQLDKNYPVDVANLEHCFDSSGQKLPSANYYIVKSGFPFHSYEIKPIVHETDCQNSTVRDANIEMYGPYGADLNFILYTTISFLLLGLFSTQFPKIKRKQE